MVAGGEDEPGFFPGPFIDEGGEKDQQDDGPGKEAGKTDQVKLEFIL
jgi:hypothetical protein